VGSGMASGSGRGKGVTELDGEVSTGVGGRKHKRSESRDAAERAGKLARLTLDKSGDPAKVKVDRECFMTSGEAEVTNSRLPKGYLYVPLDAFAGGSSQGK